MIVVLSELVTIPASRGKCITHLSSGCAEDRFVAGVIPHAVDTQNGALVKANKFLFRAPLIINVMRTRRERS